MCLNARQFDYRDPRGAPPVRRMELDHHPHIRSWAVGPLTRGPGQQQNMANGVCVYVCLCINDVPGRFSEDETWML